MDSAIETRIIESSARIGLTAEAAFARFVGEMRAWWPPEYTWSRSADVLDEIAIEPRVGGMCFERGPHGFRCDWGRVLAVDPPHRLQFTWQIGPTREPVPNEHSSSEVEVRFESCGEHDTQVTLQHRGFDRHGDQGQAYRDALASERGWPHILERYAHAGLQEEGPAGHVTGGSVP